MNDMIDQQVPRNQCILLTCSSDSCAYASCCPQICFVNRKAAHYILLQCTNISYSHSQFPHSKLLSVLQMNQAQTNSLIYQSPSYLLINNHRITTLLIHACNTFSAVLITINASQHILRHGPHTPEPFQMPLSNQSPLVGGATAASPHPWSPPAGLPSSTGPLPHHVCSPTAQHTNSLCAPVH